MVISLEFHDPCYELYLELFDVLEGCRVTSMIINKIGKNISGVHTDSFAVSKFLLLILIIFKYNRSFPLQNLTKG